MNLTVNGQSQVPPGFRFHPTEEELLQYYLKKKVANQKIDLDVIQEVDLNKLEPWDIQEKCRIGSSAQNDWYLFSHKDKKYPTGTRTNRATTAGFWKATGRDKLIFSSSRRIGMRKTLVFYKGRAPHGEKSDWIMHEYRLDDNNNNASSSNGDQISTTEDGWVICRVFKKKNYVKAFDSPKDRISPRSTTHNIDQTLSYLGKSSTHMDQERFLHLPQLQSPTNHHHHHITTDPLPFDHKNEDQDSRLNWVELDQLVAYQLNGESSREASQSSTNQFCTMMPFQQLLGSQYVDDQLYWSFNIPSSTSALLDSDYNS